MKPVLALQLFRKMGVRYVRSGILKKKHPVNPIKRKFISLESFRALKDVGKMEIRRSLKTEKAPL